MIHSMIPANLPMIKEMVYNDTEGIRLFIEDGGFGDDARDAIGICRKQINQMSKIPRDSTNIPILDAGRRSSR